MKKILVLGGYGVFGQRICERLVRIPEIVVVIAGRNQAKADKDYAGADAVREELKAMGVVLEDSREGTQWRRE